MTESKYLERFKRLSSQAREEEGEELGNLLVLKGDMMLVEKLPKLEKKVKLAGGTELVIADKEGYKETYSDKTADFGVVLMVGPGQILEDGSILRPDCQPGDVILLPGKVDWYSQFGTLERYEPYTIGRLRDSQVGMVFKDYKKVMEMLNAES